MPLQQGVTLEPVYLGHKDFKWITAKMNKTIHPSSNVKDYNVVVVYRILNEDTWTNYTQHRHKLYLENNRQMVDEKRLFHASPAAQVIGTKGFNLGVAKASGLFGAGIYFAEHSSKSNDYAFGLGRGCPTHLNRSCSQCERSILVCKVALGKVHNTTHSGAGLPAGHHSIHFTGGVDEYIVYNEKQAYPSYLVKYKTNYK